MAGERVQGGRNSRDVVYDRYKAGGVYWLNGVVRLGLVGLMFLGLPRRSDGITMILL